MFPNYQVYYKDFLQRISELPESVQTGLISLLKIRCEKGILPSKSYSDDKDYYSYDYMIPEDLIGFLPIFDEYFYPDQLVHPIIENYASDAIREYREGFDLIKNTDIKIFKSNPSMFILNFKKISDNIFNKSNDILKLLTLTKRVQFDKLLIEYYDNQIEQNDLDRLFNESNEQTYSLEIFKNCYHRFIYDKFMVFGMKINVELENYKKILEQYNIVDEELNNKIKSLKMSSEKFLNPYKAFGIINWMVFAHEYKFYNKFEKSKKLIEGEIEKFITDNEKLFEEEHTYECEDGVYTEKINSIEEFCKGIENFCEPISNSINEKLKQDLENFTSNDLINKKNFVNTKVNEYIDEEMEKLSESITDENILKAIKDNISLNMAINQLSYSLDNVFESLSNITKLNYF